MQLTNVVINALSEEAYHAMRTRDALLERWLVSDPPILRQGDIHVLTAEEVDAPAQRYYIEMIEPVQQGCVDFGKTQLILTCADHALPNAEVAHGTEPTLDLSTESDSDGIEIDERFFASSVLSSQPDRHRGLDLTHDIDDSSTVQGVGFLATPLSSSISDDDDCTLYLRTSELSKIGVLNGDWVRTVIVTGSKTSHTFI
jgi:peroxin-6